MAIGRKTGGRIAGTPNRATKEVAELLESLGCDPIEGMVRIAEDPKNKPELRGKMFAELASYVHPKPRAVELHDADISQLHVVIRKTTDPPQDFSRGGITRCTEGNYIK